MENIMTNLQNHLDMYVTAQAVVIKVRQSDLRKVRDYAQTKGLACEVIMNQGRELRVYLHSSDETSWTTWTSKKKKAIEMTLAKDEEEALGYINKALDRDTPEATALVELVSLVRKLDEGLTEPTTEPMDKAQRATIHKVCGSMGLKAEKTLYNSESAAVSMRVWSTSLAKSRRRRSKTTWLGLLAEHVCKLFSLEPQSKAKSTPPRTKATREVDPKLTNQIVRWTEELESAEQVITEPLTCPQRHLMHRHFGAIKDISVSTVRGEQCTKDRSTKLSMTLRRTGEAKREAPACPAQKFKRKRKETPPTMLELVQRWIQDLGSVSDVVTGPLTREQRHFVHRYFGGLAGASATTIRTTGGSAGDGAFCMRLCCA